MSSPELNASYEILGSTPGASLAEVEAAYKKLASRSDPARFVSGSDEERMAAMICKRLDVAYRQLRNALS